MSSGLKYCVFCSFQNPRKWIKYYFSCAIQKKSLPLSLWHVLMKKFMSVSLNPCPNTQIPQRDRKVAMGWEVITPTENKLQVSLSKDRKERISEGRWYICSKNKSHSEIQQELVNHGAIRKERLLGDALKGTGKEIPLKCRGHANSRKVPSTPWEGITWPLALCIAHVLCSVPWRTSI